ncbi:DNA repair protein RecO [Psittacicella melopsittaci]|uniref:DNA repair protein RecO n=1 Tax=Psittacicella melopsittaci TaxID=2028576 RepID=A0A3A1Y6R7_9GAMM|nr:DNA repair protein RecO [Psittacicella melopsittaci]RIY33305.1 DNA repair protein RecO [Psittacicella melopsittaci]
MWYTGFVLYREDYGNNTVRLFFLSLEKGLLHLYCKGANSKSSKLGPALQYFSLLKIQVAGKLLNYINKVEIESLAIRYPLEQFYCACYVNELIFKLLPTNDNYESFALFNFYKNALLGLFYANSTQEQSLVLRKFEFELLNYLGMLPLLNQDYAGLELEDHQNYFLIQEQGFIKSQEINLLNQELTKQELSLRQQWEQDPDSVDPLALQYLEYQQQQFQYQQELTFAGKNLKLMHEIFLEEAPSQGQIKINPQTQEQLQLNASNLASLLQVKISLDQKQQVVKQTTYKVNNSFDEQDLQQALEAKIKEFKKEKEQVVPERKTDSFSGFEALTNEQKKIFLQQSANLSKIYLSVLLGTRPILAREKLLEYKRLMQSL